MQLITTIPMYSNVEMGFNKQNNCNSKEKYHTTQILHTLSNTKWIYLCLNCVHFLKSGQKSLGSGALQSKIHYFLNNLYKTIQTYEKKQTNAQSNSIISTHTPMALTKLHTVQMPNIVEQHNIAMSTKKINIAFLFMNPRTSMNFHDISIQNDLSS